MSYLLPRSMLSGMSIGGIVRGIGGETSFVITHDTDGQTRIGRMPVQLESPYRGKSYEHTEFNVLYAQACVRDSLLRGEAPFASHLQYIGATDDKNPDERQLGIEAGLTFLHNAYYSVIYIDLGITEGMKIGIERAIKLGTTVLYRNLPDFDIFLIKNRDLLNGHHHIVGENKKLSMKDKMISHIFESDGNMTVKNNNIFIKEPDGETKAQFNLKFLNEDLTINLYETNNLNLHEDLELPVIDYIKRRNQEIDKEFEPFKDIIENYKIMFKLNEAFPPKQNKSKAKKI